MHDESLSLPVFMNVIRGWKHFVLPLEYSEDFGGLKILLLFNDHPEDKRFINFYLGWDGAGTAVVNHLEEDGTYICLKTFHVYSEGMDLKDWLSGLGAWPVHWFTELEAAQQ